MVENFTEGFREGQTISIIAAFQYYLSKRSLKYGLYPVLNVIRNKNWQSQ